MIDVERLLEGDKDLQGVLSIKTILTDRFKSLLHEQPEKLSRLVASIENSELSLVTEKSTDLQIFTANYVLGKLLYKYSGRTGVPIGTVRIALVDNCDLKGWLNLIDMGVLPMFIEHDIV